jgi:hypothetical protein
MLRNQHLRRRLLAKRREEKQRQIERRVHIARLICNELVRRGMDVPIEFQHLLPKEEEEESDRQRSM